MNNTLNLSIGLLTFNSPKTLKNTLESYKYTKLLELSDDICCIIQPSSKQSEEENICKEYNIKSYIQTSNTKMAGAIKTIWNTCKYDYMMFLECDFVICENENKIKNILNFGLTELKNDKVDLVRLRSLKNPGHPIQTNLIKTRILNSSCESNEDLKRNLNYLTNGYDNPDELYPKYIKKYSTNPKMYLMSSKYCGYTNNPYIVTRKFYINNINPHCVDGEILENRMDENWYKPNTDHRILITEGLFKHNRLDGHINCDCCPSEFGGRSNENCTFNCCSTKIEGVKYFDYTDIN
tara:strand:- start:9543 stop:10424 length:882 start_codon:yes stop_codon:yes gene_type:complete